MEINKALSLLRDGKLHECDIGDLRAMSAGCVVFIQNRIPDAIHLKEAVDDEIRRKEAAEAQRHSDAAARQMHQEATALSREEIAASHYANRLSIWAIGISVAALVVAGLSVYWQWRDRASSTSQIHSPAPSSPLSNTAPLASSPLTNAQPTNQTVTPTTPRPLKP